MSNYEDFPDPTIAPRQIALSSAWIIRRSDIMTYHIGTNLESLLSEVVGGNGWLSLTQGGAAIDAALSKPLTLPVVGVVVCKIEAVDLATYLAALVGTIIWEVVKISDDYEDSVPLLVVKTATPEMI